MTLPSGTLRTILFMMCAVMARFAATGQELNCTVEVDASQIQGNEQIFSTLQEAINEYMNTTKFTNAQFSPNEKIDCRLFFTIKEYTDDILKGDLQIQSTRPVYNSAYTAQLQGQQNRVHLP